jgi:benzoyl-CoA 2,3-dioxygenase component B
VLQYRDSGFVTIDEPALTTLNARLRDDYAEDCRKGVQRWNKVIQKAGVDFELALPHVAFHRKVGQFAGTSITPEGEAISAEAWDARQGEWLPSDADMEYIHSLMKPVLGTGNYAPWIAKPKVGIDNKPGDFEYVRLA